MKVLLNLGAGARLAGPPGEGWEVWNHDLYQHRPEINAVCNLDVIPWPWQDESIDAICAWSVFEHLRITPMQAFNECWRILRKGGNLEVKMPLYDVPAYLPNGQANEQEPHNDLTHRWYVGHRGWDGLDPDTSRGAEYDFYERRPWRILSQNEVPGGSSLYGRLEPRK